ncbi:uncharacterized protein LOC123260336 isoform X1 [Cotesia glomerata]|uniref:uncharacterized protein LOC123260336 isoform X1 n=1 Tax=Cotesia glomerata TaxID=32391 RepID=UPI001D01AF91|nr:uncharacterized protein LOC123260336 isoform X1 [Cotesia glomerata]
MYSIVLAVILLIVCSSVGFANSATIPLNKCCDNGYMLNETLQCVTKTNHSSFSPINETKLDITQSINQTQISTDICIAAFRNNNSPTCIDYLSNGTAVTLICPKNHYYINNSTDNETETSSKKCDSILKILDFWGASIVVLATIIYSIPYLIVIIVYCLCSDSLDRAYDRSVICFNISYLTLNILLTTIGFLELCHHRLDEYVYGILGLSVLYLIQTSVMWLFVICYDMTLAITRFRWVPDSSKNKKTDERKKFIIYSAAVWGVALVPMTIAAVMEFNTWLPKNSVYRPNYSSFHGQHKYLRAYSLTLPVLMLLANSLLFVYTTYKMIKIRSNKALADHNRTKNVKEKYVVYLKLYILMDAPWLSGALSAIYPNLWILKFIRIIQPILMLIVILPKQQKELFVRFFKTCWGKSNNCGFDKCKKGSKKRGNENELVVQLNN